MGHYDSCREGYCASCGAGPGNIKKGVCQYCGPIKRTKAVKGGQAKALAAMQGSVLGAENKLKKNVGS